MTAVTQRPNYERKNAAQGHLWKIDLASITLMLVVFAFPMSALFSALLSSYGIDDDIFSVAGRILTFSVASLLFVKRASSHQTTWPGRALIIFIIIYLTRLCYDSFVAGSPAAISALYFFSVATLVPTVALASIRPQDWNERSAMMVSLVVGTIFIVLTNWMLATGKGQEWIDQDIVMLNGGRQSFERLNPILLGHTAVTVTLICASLMINEASRKFRFILACIIVPSLYTVYLAASRGPILALIAGLALLTISSKRGLVIGAVAMACIVGATVFLNIDIGSLLEQLRFTSAGTDNNSVARIDFIYEAMDTFYGSPIIGANFEMPITGGWPHNIFAEILMSVGLFGMTAFLFLLFPVLSRTLSGARRGTNYAGILFIQTFVGAQFSGSLWGTAGLWVAIALVLATSKGSSDSEFRKSNMRGTAAPKNVRAPTRFTR